MCPSPLYWGLLKLWIACSTTKFPSMKQIHTKKGLVNFWELAQHSECASRAIQRLTWQVCLDVCCCWPPLSSFKFAPFLFSGKTLTLILFLYQHCFVVQSLFAEPSSEQSPAFFPCLSLFSPLLLFHTHLAARFPDGLSAASASQRIQQGTCCSPRNLVVFIILYCEKAENFSGGQKNQWLYQELANNRIASRCKGLAGSVVQSTAGWSFSW